MMEIRPRGQDRRFAEAYQKWILVGEDYNQGLLIKEIASKYGYSRSHVFWILRKLKSLLPL